MGTPKTKAIKARRYRVAWLEPMCGFERVLTLTAKNKKEATKLVADRYPAAKKHHVSCLKTA